MNVRTCTACDTPKLLRDFSAGYRRKDGSSGHRAKCKECVKKNSKAHYYENSEGSKRYDGTFDTAIYGKQRLIAFRAWIDSLKRSPCSDCHNKFLPVCMDFDHVRGTKVKNISGMWSWERSKVLEELVKCDLVCANCHRIRTHERRVRLQETG